MLSSGLGNISTAKGIQATAGIGRSNSSGGISRSLNNLERPTPSPIAIANTAAQPKPEKTLATLLNRWPWNFAELTSWTAAWQTAEGEGTFSKFTITFHLFVEARYQRTIQASSEAHRVTAGTNNRLFRSLAGRTWFPSVGLLLTSVSAIPITLFSFQLTHW